MRTIFYDVDTLKDFMNENGALYVPKAEELKFILYEIEQYRRKKGVKKAGSVDRHFIDDSELKRNGGPFDDHGMNGSEGQKHIAETLPLNPLFVENKIAPGDNYRIYSDNEIENIANHEGEIIFEKQSYDVFTNPATEKVLEAMGVERAIIYGVATDYCIKAAAIGMAERGIEVYVLSDAVKSIAPDTEKQALSEMEKAGVQFVEFSNLETILGGGQD